MSVTLYPSWIPFAAPMASVARLGGFALIWFVLSKHRSSITASDLLAEDEQVVFSPLVLLALSVQCGHPNGSSRQGKPYVQLGKETTMGCPFDYLANVGLRSLTQRPDAFRPRPPVASTAQIARRKSTVKPEACMQLVSEDGEKCLVEFAEPSPKEDRRCPQGQRNESALLARR